MAPSYRPPLRPATSADVPALADLGRRTFIDTFVNGFGIPYPPEDLEHYLTHAFSEATVATQLADPAQRWWVGERDSRVVGFAQAGPCALPHPEARPTQGELKRLYIDRPAQGQGYGQALLETALAWLEATFEAPLWIGVWSGNLKAQRLYARYGFARAGEYDYPVGAWRDREFILRRP